MANKTPGASFEDEIQRSFPKKTRSGRPINARKIPKPATRREDVAEGGKQRTFSPKVPYDFDVIAEANPRWCGADGWRFGAPGNVVPVISFALECKRTAAKIARRTSKLHSILPFSAVKSHQVKGLQAAGAAGAVAGILWLASLGREKSARGWPDQCWFIPIETWIRCRDHRYISDTAKSLGLDVVASLGSTWTAPAIEIHEDVNRPRIKNRYWKLGEFLSGFGADVEA